MKNTASIPAQKDRGKSSDLVILCNNSLYGIFIFFLLRVRVGCILLSFLLLFSFFIDSLYMVLSLIDVFIKVILF